MANSEINGFVAIASGKTLHCRVTGDGPAVVFMHGLGSSLNFWGPSIDLADLAKSFRVVRYDFDGAGLSPLSTATLSIESLVEDLLHLLDTLSITKASIVGHSMSGLVASTFAARHADRVQSLVLVGAILAPNDKTRNTMSTRAATAKSKGGMQSLADAVPSGALSKHTLMHNPLAYHFTRQLVGSTKPEGYAAACLAIVNSRDPEYRSIRAPTLVIAGAEDPMSPKSATERFEHEIANCKSVTLPSVGHWQPLEDPQSVARALADFLAA